MFKKRHQRKKDEPPLFFSYQDFSRAYAEEEQIEALLLGQRPSLPIVSASVVYTNVDTSSESGQSTRSSCLSTPSSSTRCSLSSSQSTTFHLHQKLENSSDIRLQSTFCSTSHGRSRLTTFRSSSFISSKSKSDAQINQISTLWAHRYCPSTNKMNDQSHQPPTPMVTTVFIGSSSKTSGQQQSTSIPSFYSYQQPITQQQPSFPQPLLSLPPPPLQFSGPSNSSVLNVLNNDHENAQIVSHNSYGLPSSAFDASSTSIFATPNTLSDCNTLNNYSVHVPPPTHFSPVPNTLRVLQSTDFSTNAPVSTDSTSFVNTSTQNQLATQSLIDQQQQMLQQQLEQYRQKQLELEQLDAFEQQLNVQENSQLQLLHQFSSQQHLHRQQQTQLQSLRPFSSLLLRSALNQQSVSAPHSPDTISVNTSSSPASTSTLPLDTQCSEKFSVFHDGHQSRPYSAIPKSEDREEVESGVGRSETCSDSFDSLCGRSSAGSSGCTEVLSGSGQNFCSVSKTGRNSLRSVDSALRVSSEIDIEQQKEEAATHESQEEAAAYAFRRPAELTHCTHQIKFTKTPGFSCCSCLLLFLSLLLISIFLTTAVFFGVKAVDGQNSNELAEFKGQFVATRGILTDPDLEHRKGAQYQRLANDLRSRLDHLLNTSRWSGRFIRSELLFVEPIVSKEKQNHSISEQSEQDHAINDNRSINKFGNDWLNSIQENAIVKTIDNNKHMIAAHLAKPSDVQPPGTHWLHFRIYFNAVPTSLTKSSLVQSGPSASDLYLLLSEELIRQPSGLFAKYGITQSSLSIAERVPTISALAQLHLLWQWMRSPNGQWPSWAMLSRKTQQRLNRPVTSISSAASALRSIGSFQEINTNQLSSDQLINSIQDPSVSQHFSDGSVVHPWSDQLQSFSHCEPLKLSMCDFLPYQSVSYPNLLGHQNYTELEKQLLEYRQMIDAECDPVARQLLCTLLQPPCKQHAGSVSKSKSTELLLHSSETRIRARWQQNCGQMSERLLSSCGDWAPSSLITRLRIALEKPEIAFGTHAELVCSVGESECVQRLRNSNQQRICDFVTDCEDGTDEQHCEPNACNKQKFKESGKFDAIWKRSAGGRHLDIKQEQVLKQQWFDCGSRCIPMSQRCDGKVQCDNGLDEFRCLHQDKDIMANATNWSVPTRSLSGPIRVFIAGQSHLICSDNLFNQSDQLTNLTSKVCQQMGFESADSFDLNSNANSVSLFARLKMENNQLSWSQSDCNTRTVLSITCTPHSCGQTCLRHQPALWLMQRRTWTLNSELIAFAPAPSDWPWFGQLTLHEQFLCDVTLINKRWAAVSSACLRRWGQVSISSSDIDVSTVTKSKQQLDATAMAVRFGLVSQGHRQPPAALQSRVKQIQESGPISWLQLVPNECDQASVVDDRCVRSQTMPACTEKSIILESDLFSETTTSGVDQTASNSKSINQKNINQSKLTRQACFTVFTDLNEERTLFMASSVIDLQQCRKQSLSKNATIFKRPALKHVQPFPILHPTSDLCVKAILQHKQQSSLRRLDSAQELNQKLAQQPGSPLYCFKDNLGWTLIGLMRKPLEAKCVGTNSVELFYEFERIQNYPVEQQI